MGLSRVVLCVFYVIPCSLATNLFSHWKPLGFKILLQELRSHIGREECRASFKGQDPMSRSSRCTFLQLKGRDAVNTWEVDTPVKPPHVLFCIFLGNITHDQILKGAGVGLQFKCFIRPNIPLAV